MLTSVLTHQEVAQKETNGLISFIPCHLQVSLGSFSTRPAQVNMPFPPCLAYR